MPDIILQPFASQGDVATVPQADPNGFVNFQEGYTRYYEISLSSGDPQAKAVERQAQNYLFRLITDNLQAWQQMGMPPWYSDMPGGYQKDAQIVYRTAVGQPWKVYRSTKDANISVPGANADWQYVQTSAEMLSHVPAPMGAGDPTQATISAAIDFNTKTASGTWRITDDAVAAACPNAPVSFDKTTATAGTLRVILSGVQVYQQYQDRFGNFFFRARSDSTTWFSWDQAASIQDIQKNTFNFAADTGAVNALVCAFKPALSARSDGMILAVKVKVSNTGVTTINDGIGVVGLKGQTGNDMIGGELIANRTALIAWNATAGAYFVVMADRGAQQIAVNSYLTADPPANDSSVKVISSGWARANMVPYRGQMAGSPDLNNFTGRGMYVCAYSVITNPVNFPAANSGVLIVGSLSGADSPLQTNYVTQEYHTVTNRVFRRVLNTGVWAAWIELAKVDSQAFTGTPTVPDPAVRNNSQQIPSTKWVNDNTFFVRGALGSTEDLDNFYLPGIYWQATNAGASGGTNYPAGLAGALEVIREGDGATPNKIYQRYTTYGSAAGTTPRMYIRGYYNSGTPGWSPWFEMARLDSPVFTGDPKAPTPAQYDNDTSVATTAHVLRAVGSYRGATGTTADKAFSDADVGRVCVYTGAGGTNFTMPAPATEKLGSAFIVSHQGTGGVLNIVLPAGVDMWTTTGTIPAAGTLALQRGESAVLVMFSTTRYVIADGTVLLRLAPPTTSRAGEIAMVGANFLPVGALKCNGAAISRTTYADLFAKIGTTYGAGDGSTTFNLPDARGLHPRFWDDGRGIDPGRVIGSFQDHMLFNHSHTAWSDTAGWHGHGMDGVGDHQHIYTGVPAASNPDGQGASSGASYLDLTQHVSWWTDARGGHAHGIWGDGNHTHGIGTGVSGGGGENRVKNMAFQAVIFYQ